ncbi:hypothetical protein LXL04_018340 [Taraxacum kok-saghyz]
MDRAVSAKNRFNRFPVPKKVVSSLPGTSIDTATVLVPPRLNGTKKKQTNCDLMIVVGKRMLSHVPTRYHSSGTVYPKASHLTKPTSKTTCTNRNGPKAIQDQVLVSRINLTRVPNPFATREPGQPSVRRRGMTTTSHTDPDASLSLLRRISPVSLRIFNEWGISTATPRDPS